jgi:hypothetical protein
VGDDHRHGGGPAQLLGAAGLDPPIEGPAVEFPVVEVPVPGPLDVVGPVGLIVPEVVPGEVVVLCPEEVGVDCSLVVEVGAVLLGDGLADVGAAGPPVCTAGVPPVVVVTTVVGRTNR